MKNRSKFKDIQRFKEIASILSISFEQAEALFWKLNRAPSIDQMYADMIEEAGPEFEPSIDVSKLNISSEQKVRILTRGEIPF